MGELLDLLAGAQVDHRAQPELLGDVTHVLVAHERERVAAVHAARTHEGAVVGLVTTEVTEVCGTVERDESFGHGQRSRLSMRMALPRQILSTTSWGRSAIISRGELLGVRPRRVGVRVVRLERGVVHTDALERFETVHVTEEAAVDLAVVVRRRRVRHDPLHATPCSVLAPNVVRALEDVRDPADLALRVRELQARIAHEHAGEEEVREARHRVAEAERRGDRGRRVDGGGRHLRARPDVHADHGPRLLARDEERIPVAGVDAREAEVGWNLAEADRVHTTRRVAPDLGRRQIGVPEWDERKRDQPTAAVTAPLLDHPVVVRVDAGRREVTVLRLEERLAAEARERGERERRLDPIDVHVVEAGLRVRSSRAASRRT